VNQELLSLPAVYDNVERAESVTVTALDRNGGFHLECLGMLATCIQHEWNHLEARYRPTTFGPEAEPGFAPSSKSQARPPEPGPCESSSPARPLRCLRPRSPAAAGHEMRSY